MKTLKHFMLPEQTNELYKKEAVSSISLTRDVAEKINELVDAYNELSKGNLAKEQEQDGRISKAVLFMKDNLLNSVHDLFETLVSSGECNELITSILSQGLSTSLSRLNGVVSLKEFGAVGDGICDDSAALFAALNSGKMVDLGGGTYYHSQEIDSHNLKLLFNGTLKGATVHFNAPDLALVNVTFDGCDKYSCVTVWNNNVSVLGCTFKNVKNSDSVVYGLNVRKCQNIRIIGCTFENFTAVGTNALRAIRLEDTLNAYINHCFFNKMTGVDDGDYIHVYSLDTATYTTITNCMFIVEECKSAIKVQAGAVYIRDNRFICAANSDRIYALVRIQNGGKHIVENNLFFANQQNATSYPAIMLLCENCGSTDIRGNTFEHHIRTGYDANTGANIIKLINTTDVIIEENRFGWLLMFRALYLIQSTGKAPTIRNNHFFGPGCCVIFEEGKGSFLFEQNKVELSSKGGYLAPIFSNGSATVNNNDITFNEYSAVSVQDNLILKGNILRNNNENSVVDIIQIASGTGFLRDNTYDGNVRYQVKGSPSSLSMEAMIDQLTGTPLGGISNMAAVNYFPSRYKCNTLDFGHNDPTFTPRPMQLFYSTQKKTLMLYVDGAWVSAAFA